MFGVSHNNTPSLRLFFTPGVKHRPFFTHRTPFYISHHRTKPTDTHAGAVYRMYLASPPSLPVLLQQQEQRTCGFPKRLLSLSGSYVAAAPARGTPKTSATPPPPAPPPLLPPSAAVALERWWWSCEEAAATVLFTPVSSEEVPPPVSCAKKALNADILDTYSRLLAVSCLCLCLPPLSLADSPSFSLLCMMEISLDNINRSTRFSFQPVGVVKITGARACVGCRFARVYEMHLGVKGRGVAVHAYPVECCLLVQQLASKMITRHSTSIGSESQRPPTHSPE